MRRFGSGLETTGPMLPRGGVIQVAPSDGLLETRMGPL